MHFPRHVFIAILVVFLFYGQSLLAHCQIPCGIYTDQMRFQMIEEHITTIEKSMKQVVELSGGNPVNYNQLIRWVNNKEEHAQQIQDIVHAYFLTQRVKPADRDDAEAYKKYSHKVVLLHQLLFYAMKTKQTTDLANVEKLRLLLSEFHNVYFDKEAKEHFKEEHR